MFKFIHAADIHLDSPLSGLERYDGAPAERLRQASRRALENLISLAITEQVQFVVIAGDLFDRDWKDYNTGLYFVQQMSRLKAKNIAAFILKGNHDAESRVTKSLPLPDNVHIFSHKEPQTFRLENCPVSIHGQSFATSAVTDDLSLNYPAGDSGRFNIGVLHTCAAGREGHAPYAPCKLEILINKGYNYWALGHVHKREVLNQDPLIIFPGNIQGRHVRETGSKGCSLVSVDDRYQIQESFQELCVVRWEVCQVDASSCENNDQVLEVVRTALANLLEQGQGMPLAVRLEIHGQSPADAQLRAQKNHFVESARSIAIQLASDLLWLEKIKILTSAPTNDSASLTAEGPLSELLEYIDEIGKSALQWETLEKELADLKAKLPADLPEATRFSDPQWHKEVMDDVKQILLERLYRPGQTK
ncbi:MAG: DNA repair exonuclease [Candidatus Obscuribacterales bacterium]|nr:DNA repair exonuclease [Candidatus Obscuribacterales bacterium]